MSKQNTDVNLDNLGTQFDDLAAQFGYSQGNYGQQDQKSHQSKKKQDFFGNDIIHDQSDDIMKIDYDRGYNAGSNQSGQHSSDTIDRLGVVLNKRYHVQLEKERKSLYNRIVDFAFLQGSQQSTSFQFPHQVLEDGARKVQRIVQLDYPDLFWTEIQNFSASLGDFVETLEFEEWDTDIIADTISRVETFIQIHVFKVQQLLEKTPANCDFSPKSIVSHPQFQAVLYLWDQVLRLAVCEENSAGYYKRFGEVLSFNHVNGVVINKFGSCEAFHSLFHLLLMRSGFSVINFGEVLAVNILKKWVLFDILQASYFQFQDDSKRNIINHFYFGVGLNEYKRLNPKFKFENEFGFVYPNPSEFVQDMSFSYCHLLQNNIDLFRSAKLAGDLSQAQFDELETQLLALCIRELTNKNMLKIVMANATAMEPISGTVEVYFDNMTTKVVERFFEKVKHSLNIQLYYYNIKVIPNKLVKVGENMYWLLQFSKNDKFLVTDLTSALDGSIFQKVKSGVLILAQQNLDANPENVKLLSVSQAVQDQTKAVFDQLTAQAHSFDAFVTGDVKLGAIYVYQVAKKSSHKRD